MIARELTDKILLLARQFPAVALLGPRQSGKTTLAQGCFAQHRYISLEDLDIRQRAALDPRGFLEDYPNEYGIILDEVQHVPELLSYMQTIIDKEKKKGFFIITGSQNLLLNEAITQTLAGRIGIATLLPLSISELQQAHVLPNQLEDAMLRGCYPAIYADDTMTIDSLYPNYIRTYVERDVRTIKQVGDLVTFQRFIQLCAGRVGQVLNLTSLGNDCGIDHKTARAWISVLEASYLIFLLQPYYKNYGKRVIKAPKLYFFDTGILCSLLRIKTKEDLMEHHLRGSIAESFIISDLFKQHYNSYQQPDIYFWRDTQGHEVDCIIEQGARITPIEIKAGKTIASDYFDQLIHLNKIIPTIRNNFVIFAGNENHSWPHAEVLGWQASGTLLKRLT